MSITSSADRGRRHQSEPLVCAALHVGQGWPAHRDAGLIPTTSIATRLISSTNGKTWAMIPADRITLNAKKSRATLKLDLPKGPGVPRWPADIHLYTGAGLDA